MSLRILARESSTKATCFRRRPRRRICRGSARRKAICIASGCPIRRTTTEQTYYLCVKIALFVAVAALISSQALAQDDARLATPTGHEVNVSIGGYTYTEPGALSISIDGVKIGGEYTGTLSLSKRRRVFAQADVRGTFGNVT